MELFHGTTHNFEKFSLKACNPENHAGIGVYLTNDINDAKKHYAGRGPDLRNRIGKLTCEIHDEYENRMSWSESEQLAIDILDGKRKFLLRCEIKPEAKLLKLSNNDFIDFYELYEDDDYADYSEAGIAMELICEAFNMEYPEVCEMTTIEIFRWIRDVYDYDNGICCGEIFRWFVELMGFDGIEYEDASHFFPYMVEKGTKHFVLYNPEMVKIKYKQEL